MSLELIAEIWDEMKIHMGPADVPTAADSLVDILIHNDYEVAEIKQSFAHCKLVREAVAGYVVEEEEQAEVDFEDDSYFEDEDEEIDY